MRVALSLAPLSSSFRSFLLETNEGPLECFSIAEARRGRSWGAILGDIRRLDGDTVYVVLEDRNSLALLPALHAVAALTRSRRLTLVDPERNFTPLTRLGSVGSLSRFVAASLDGRLTAHSCVRELAILTAAPRAEVAAVGGKELVYLNTDFWFGAKTGGSIGHIAGVANAFALRGSRVDYYATGEPVMFDPSIAWHPVPPLASFGLPSELNLPRFHRRYVKQVAPALTGGRPLLYQRMSLSNYTGVELSRRLGLPLILEYNGSEVWIARKWGARPLTYEPLARAAEEACLRHAHLIVTISDTLRDELLERGVESERIVTYPNGIDPTIFDPSRFSPADIKRMRAHYGIEPDAVVVTFVGTFGKWHGAEVFAESVAREIDERADELARRKIRFLFVGDGLKAADVRSMLGDDRYRSFVTMTGLTPQHEAPLHLAASDICVSPHVPNEDGSRFFGSPTKLFEYMAMGKPVIASDLEQVGEVMRPGLTLADLAGTGDPDAHAVLVKPGDPDELRRAIRGLTERPALRSAIGENGRKVALARHTWERHVDVIVEGARSTGIIE